MMRHTRTHNPITMPAASAIFMIAIIYGITPKTMNVQESLIADYMRNALILGLSLDPSQAKRGAKKTYDPLWRHPFYLVVPGNSSPYGPGRGAQDGGSLIRSMPMTVTFYDRLELDQYGDSDEVLVNLQDGTLPQFEAIRLVFDYTFFANPDGSDALLMEPLWVTGESSTEWQDQEGGVYSRDFTFAAVYGQTIKTAISVTRPQVSNPVG